MKRSPLIRKTPMKRTAMKRILLTTMAVDVSSGRAEYAVKHWREVERSTIEGRKARGSAVQVFRATAKAAKRKPAQNQPAQRIRQTSQVRAAQRREYNKMKPAYLAAHPFCQITICRLGLNEQAVITANGSFLYPVGSPAAVRRQVPFATELHHRNKANGCRLTNFDYIMSASAGAHRWEEEHKDEARAMGILCPINCRPDGTMPDGMKQPTTIELLAQRQASK